MAVGVTTFPLSLSLPSNAKNRPDAPLNEALDILARRRDVSPVGDLIYRFVELDRIHLMRLLEDLVRLGVSFTLTHN